MYGDATDATGQDSQLIPLIKQLIAMLESGGPFYLSPELLNIINRHDNGGSDSTNINVIGTENKKCDKCQLDVFITSYEIILELLSLLLFLF